MKFSNRFVNGLSGITSLYAQMLTPLFLNTPSETFRRRRMGSSLFSGDLSTSSSLSRLTMSKSLLYEKCSTNRHGCRLTAATPAPCTTRRIKLLVAHRIIAMQIEITSSHTDLRCNSLFSGYVCAFAFDSCDDVSFPLHLS